MAGSSSGEVLRKRANLLALASLGLVVAVFALVSTVDSQLAFGRFVVWQGLYDQWFLSQFVHHLAPLVVALLVIVTFIRVRSGRPSSTVRSTAIVIGWASVGLALLHVEWWFALNQTNLGLAPELALAGASFLAAAAMSQLKMRRVLD